MDFSATGGAVQYPVRGFGSFKATRWAALAGEILSALAGKMLWRQRTFFILLAVCFFAKPLIAQTTLNVTSFGAVGDAAQVWVSTTAGSGKVAFTNTLSAADIGKTIELFGVGQFNKGNNVVGVYVTNAQDLIAVITNVDDSNNAYISGDIPTIASNNVYCIYGNNNVAAFASCIAAAPTNAVIYIPAGNIGPGGQQEAYLLVPPEQYTNFNYFGGVNGTPDYYTYGLGDCGITITRGGLWFTGDGEEQSILMADGAYKNQGGECMRGGIFYCEGAITNDYPLVWSNLTFSAGLPRGLDGYQGVQPADWVDGRGWDGWSCAGLDTIQRYGDEPLNSFTEFVNCDFHGFRGEVLKGNFGNLSERNETKLLTNCFFWDNNATAFNYNYAHTIEGCTFSNMYQIEEFYLAYPTNAPSYFINNYATNITHNLISLNGGTLTNQPYIISNNVFYCDMDGNGIATCPASSVLIASNLFISEPYAGDIIGDNAIVIGEAGAQPGDPNAFNKNITIVDNTFSNNFYNLFACGGGTLGDPNIACNVLFGNNTIYSSGNVSFYSGGIATNVSIVDNNCFGVKMGLISGLLGSTYAFIGTNNNYWTWLLEDGDQGNPIKVSYGGGSRYLLTYPYSSSVHTYLSVSDGSQIPIGASMLFTNGTWNSQPVTIYTAGPNFSGPSVTIPYGGTMTLYWGGNAWVTNAIVKFTESISNGVSRLPVQFNSPGSDSGGNTIKNWNWDFGDGTTSTAQNPLHSYTNLGTFYPVLTVSNLAHMALTASGAAITVTNPMIKFAASLSNACPFLTVQFTSPSADSGGNTITNWSWNFGDGTYSSAQNPLHAFASPGIYNPGLTVINTYGLSPASSGPAVTVVNPTVKFTASPSNGVSRLAVAFKAPSIDSLGVSIKGWAWNFGDGTAGTGQNPSHTYTNVGPYYPVLTITNTAGATATTSGVMITVTNPIVKFTASHTNACPFLTIQFTSPATDSGGNKITNWLWNFGDGTSSTVENPTHIYTSTQTYNPVLTVVNAYGLSPNSSGPAINVVNPTVQFTASPSNGVSRLTAAFKSPLVDSIGVSIKTWQWSFGDGTFGAGQNPTHTYTNLGTYVPALTISNTLGLTATSSGTITVTNPAVKFTANHTNACPLLTIQFTSPATDSGGNKITNWLWNFGDGTSSTVENPTHVYTSTQTYSPVLTVVNAYGLSPAASGPAINVVNPTVQFTAGPSNGVSRLAVAFKSPTMDSVGVSIKTWQWNFGDGTTGVGQNPTHSYTNIGTYLPVLTISNTLGLTATSSGSIIVTNPAVKFTASPTNACSFLTIQFTSPAMDSGGNRITNWLWNFGDGTSSTVENPAHIYTNIQTYNPVLTVANAYGLFPSSSGPAIKVVNPTAQFTAGPSNGVSRLTVAFKSPSVDSVGVSIKSWRWSFGDGTFGTGQNPSHTYTNTGIYFPALTVSNALGLFPVTSGSAVTVTNPAIKFTASITNGTAPLAVQFKAPSLDSGGNTITNWYWNFGDGAISTVENPSHTYANSGTFHPTLFVANAFGLAPTSSGPVIFAKSNSGVQVASSPQLSVTLDNGVVALSWPTNASGYTLQFTTNLIPPANWMIVTSPPVVINGQNVVTNATSAPQMFFRLEQ
jgi:PKD repeat protein